MAEADFKKLREDLEKIVSEAWKADKDRAFRRTLQSIFGSKALEMYAECATDTTKDFAECLEDAADSLGLRDKFRSAWRGAPAPVVNKLMEVRSRWSRAERDAIRSAVRAKDIPKLYKMCAYGKYDDVAKELGLEETPEHFKKCVKMVAEAQDLKSALETVWGTAS